MSNRVEHLVLSIFFQFAMKPHLSFSEAEIGEGLFYNYKQVVDSAKDLCVRDAGVKGKGLFTKHFIKKKAFIIEYWGETIDRATKNERVKSLKSRNIRAQYFARLGGGLFIDATHCNSMARRANHSCSPNCRLYRVKVKDEHGNFVRIVALYALHDIEAGGALEFDYGPPSSDPFQNEPCYCGTSNCRGQM